MGALPLRIDKGSPELLEQFHDLGSGDVLKCYQCGTCVGECPAILSDLHVRRLMKYSIYGLERLLLENEGVWGCTTCHLCSQRCPEDASPYELVMAVRRYQSRSGKLPEALGSVSRKILTLGHSVDMEEKHKKARIAVGLPELPPTIIRHPEMLAELRAIAEARNVTEFLDKGGEG